MENNSTFKKSVSITASFASVVGFLSDLGTPIANFSLYLMIISIAAVIVFGVLYFCCKKGWKFSFDPPKMLACLLSSVIGCVILTSLFIYNQSYPETGIVAGNFDSAKEWQQTLFNISAKQDEILDSQRKMQGDVRDIKEIVSGEAEIKNLSNVGDMSIVEDLNEATKDKNAIRVAITYFDNTGGEASMDKLKKGLADMLISDLSNVHLLQIVERDKLESLLAEQKLSNTKSFDASTAAKLGKLLGAKQIVVGSFFEMFGSLRLDARFVDVETGSISKAEGVEGETAGFFKLEKALAWKLIRNLDVKLLDKETEAINNSTAISYEDFEKYSEALVQYDKGNWAKSKEIASNLLKKYPNLQLAKSLLDKLKIKNYEKN